MSGQGKHILVIDDDPAIGDLLAEALTGEGYRVSRAWSGTEAVLFLERTVPDLALLDLMLPGLAGEQVLPRLKGVPVIVVSAKADLQSKVDLLLGGAADYVTKPFELRELLARIAARLREGPGPEASRLRWDGLELDTDSRMASVGDEQVRLTRTECAILKLLLLHPGQVVTRSVILDRISLDTPDCTETSLKMHVSNLRKKLRGLDGRDRIEAVWGIGFQLRSAEKPS